MTNTTGGSGEGGRGGHPRRPHWPVEWRCGPASELHALGIPEPTGRLVRVLEVDRPALVLGSTQRAAAADGAACASGGVDVVRRRSGGGAVLVEPDRLVWVDVVVPPGDPRWCDDVGRSFFWLGEAWASALGRFEPAASLRVHRGGLVCPNRWGRLVCFAGVGPGEVLAGNPGAKVVGMAQRRTRSGALFQCAVPLAWDPMSLLELLELPAGDRQIAATELAAAVAPLSGTTAADVVGALVSELGCAS